ncbi:MAG: hypothetical protein ACYCTV_01595 [Leptospirales bacterium]
MKAVEKLLILSGFLLLGACAASEYPGEITNGRVGDSSTRVEASTSHKTIMFVFSADGKSNPALARSVNNKLAKLCAGGKLENVTLDLSRKEIWFFAQRETLRGTANCIKPMPLTNK